MLQQLDHLPDGLLALDATELHDALGGPTLIHLQGRHQPALFVSVLMHGNETTGWFAIRDLLKAYTQEQRQLPRALSLFIGNTEAAKHAVRHLPDQPDYNRVWPGNNLPKTPQHDLMQQVVDVIAERGAFASVDIHNNTGLNPHYVCVNRLDNRSLHLANLFSRTVVYFTKPVGVQSMAMTQVCPAVTLECGKIGQDYSTSHAREYIDACMHLSEHPEHTVAPHDIDLFHTTAIVKVAQEIKFGYHGENLDLKLTAELEKFNFRELKAQTAFGQVSDSTDMPFEVITEHSDSAAHRYFETVDNTIRTKVPIMPSMLTPNTEVIRQDCLCYIMERYDQMTNG